MDPRIIMGLPLRYTPPRIQWAPTAASTWYIPTASYTVFGELSADGKDIAIICTGDDVRQAVAQLSKLTPTGSIIADGHALTMPCSWPLVVQLAYTFGAQWQPGGRLTEWMQNEAVRRVQWSTKPLRYPLPAGLTLKSWQGEAVRQVAHVGCLLEDAPRLGKTISTIVGLAERALWGHVVTPIIVVCPSSVVTAWVREFELWAPHWKTVAWRGGTRDARRLLVGRHQVYVASYETARNDAKANYPLAENPLMRIKANTVVIDEYHWIKNPDAQRTRAAQRLARAAQLVIPLSGTPFTHNFSDTQPTLEVFERGAFPSKERLADRYCLEINQDYGSKIVGLNPRSEPELRACFLGRQIRRSREDVRSDLSQKTYSARILEIPPKYRKMYDDMERKMIAELDSGEELSVMSALVKMNRLQYLAAAACNVETTYTDDPDTGAPVEHQHVTPIAPSWKVEAMLEVLAELEWPALAFGISRPLMVLAGEAATAAGLRVGYVVGEQTHRKRQDYVDAFQAGKLDLLCVTTAAGGTGLTLNAAGTAIFLQRPCSYVESTQAEDRGIGDRYPTLDIVDIFANNTIDERIRHILHDKAAQLSEYFRDPRIVRQLFGGILRPKMNKKSA